MTNSTGRVPRRRGLHAVPKELVEGEEALEPYHTSEPDTHRRINRFDKNQPTKGEGFDPLEHGGLSIHSTSGSLRGIRTQQR